MTRQQMEKWILEWLCNQQSRYEPSLTDRTAAKAAVDAYYNDLTFIRTHLPDLAAYLDSRSGPKIKRNLPEWF